MERKTGAKEYVLCAVYAKEIPTKPIATWSMPQTELGGKLEIDDEVWSSRFGEFQVALKQIQHACLLVIDFSNAIWIDPLPLLSLLTEAKNFCARTLSSLKIELGKTARKDQEGVGFLKFLVQHGFLEALIPLSNGTVTLKGKEYSLENAGQLAGLRSSADLHYSPPDSRFLSAKIIRLHDVHPSGGDESVAKTNAIIDASVSTFVQKWLEEMIECGLGSYFEGEPELIDNFCHRVRVLLTELMLNAYKHAYGKMPKREQCHFGIYARLRGHPPSEKAYELVRSRELGNNTTLQQLNIEKDDVAFDLFYVDAGVGITSDLEEWKKNASGLLLRRLKSIKESTNVLHKVCLMFFKDPISRLSREDNTPQTGFQHIGMILSDTEDFARVYSDGQWTGAMLPWIAMSTGSMRNLNKEKTESLPRAHPCKGTAWHYCMRLESKLRIKRDPRRQGWPSIRADDVERYADKAMVHEEFHCYDERIVDDYFEWWRQPIMTNKCLWLPRVITKQHVRQWYARIVENHEAEGSETVVWTIADISFVQALTVASVVEAQKLRSKRKRNIEIRIVTSDWLMKCYSMVRNYDEISFVYDPNRTEEAARNDAANIYNALKRCDSAVFWEGIIDDDKDSGHEPNISKEDMSPPFCKEKVIWSRGGDGKPDVILNGYLDLSEALVNPTRFLVAVRALRRTWHLHSADAECLDADGLMINLLPREAKLSLKEKSQEKNSRLSPVFVGSVYVTGSTTERFDRQGSQCIYLIRHPNFEDKRPEGPSKLPSFSRFALNWSEKSYAVSPTPKNKLKYERIPETPYISRGGMKAIPIRRFDRPNKSKNRKEFEKSLYGQAPRETYEHIAGLKVMKLGHWSDGKHHDLITLNLDRAVDLESRDNGPIIQWLIDKFKALKAKNVDVVVYPSHPVTERIVRILKKNAAAAGSSSCVPSHFIPVRFLVQHAQISIRIPSNTYDRIRLFLDSEKKLKRKHNVVLLDDGVLTGKVQRELEQLILNAGAKGVIHLCLVNRMGLPLYRQLMINQEKQGTHHYYWRWDVPTLGNARTCPLCRAIEQAGDLSKVALNKDVSDELLSWKERWEQKEVVSDWYSHGLEPLRLPRNREITFGKEWRADSDESRYRLEHSTTTGLAATVIEIMRATSYMEVGDKFAKSPWPDDIVDFKSEEWRRAKIELLVSQILLFFDDLDNKKIILRFNLLLSDLIENRSEDAGPVVEMLACLVLLLVSESQAKELAAVAIRALSKVRGVLALRPSIVVATLLQRAGFDFFSPRELLIAAGVDAQVTEPKMRIALSHIVISYAGVFGLTANKTRSALLFLIMTIGADMDNAHHGFFRQRVMKGSEITLEEILSYLKQIKVWIKEVSLIASVTVGSCFDVEGHAEKVDVLISKVERLSKEPINSRDIAIADVRHGIFGENSLAKQFHDNFFCSIKGLEKFLKSDLDPAGWRNQFERKRGRFSEARWVDPESGSYRSPYILPVVQNDCDRDAIIVFPPIARQMVKEFLFNTIYSTESFDFRGEKVDVLCDISLLNGFVSVEIRNRYTDFIQPKGSKLSETIVSQYIHRDPASLPKYDKETGEVVVVVKFPVIDRFAEE